MSIFYRVFDQAGESNEKGVQAPPVDLPDGEYPLSTYAYTIEQIQDALDRQGIKAKPTAFLTHLHQLEGDVIACFKRACDEGLLFVAGIAVVEVADPDDPKYAGWLHQWSDGRQKAQSREGRNRLGVLNAHGEVTLTGSGSAFFDMLLVLADGRIIPVSIKGQWIKYSLKPKCVYSSDGRTVVERCLAGMPFATLNVGVREDGSAIMEWIDSARAIRSFGKPAVKTAPFRKGTNPAPPFYFVVKTVERKHDDPRDDWYLIASNKAVKAMAMDDESITYGRKPERMKGGVLSAATDWNPANLPDGLLASALRLSK